ncbi:hypothetical protein [Pseudomonas sp. Q11]|uniref:hypothetical protein n=1 Tax=Pseudomonas sp. Q11 TaxID=2968470 RepID=UPI00210EF22F|nr:hypothetical protein [Pseudomonas sp. Q11]MCQ6255315.1 hypothetical protein [Pseudomonas sp. Q11]
MTWSGRDMRFAIHENGTVELSREQVEPTEPDGDEIVVRIEATPVNSRDVGLLLGPADLSRNEEVGDENRYLLTLNVSPPAPFHCLSTRESLPIGNEAANEEFLIDPQLG